jgi:hypothetical protein
MRHQKPICYALLFGPAIVLVVWALALAIDHGILSQAAMVFFLVVLALSVVAAEMVRIHIRRQIRRERKRDHHRAANS